MRTQGCLLQKHEQYFYNKLRENEFLLDINFHNHVQTCRSALIVCQQEHHSGHSQPQIVSWEPLLVRQLNRQINEAYEYPTKKRRKPFLHFYFIQCVHRTTLHVWTRSLASGSTPEGYDFLTYKTNIPTMIHDSNCSSSFSNFKINNVELRLCKY